MKTRSMSRMLHDTLFSYMTRVGLVLTALPLVADKLDDIPEAQRPLYVEKDGKHHLDVTGVEDTTNLKSALQKERDAAKANAKALKDLQDQFKDIDPVKVREMMGKLDQDGEAALIAAGKIDEVVGKRSEKLRVELQKQVDLAHAEAKAAGERANKFSQRVLDNHIRQAAGKAGLHTHAVEDALFRARNMFSLNEDGDAVQLAADGSPVLGKDGKTAFTPLEWLESMKETAPHWFPAGSSGGGAEGSKGGAGGAKTMTRSAFNALPAGEKAAAAKAYKIMD